MLMRLLERTDDPIFWSIPDHMLVTPAKVERRD
jgi:hypothetical protein